MAIKASATVTLTAVRDIKSVTWYYLLQSSTAAAPQKPTASPPGGSWVMAEPTYTAGSTNSLYIVERTVYTDGTYDYSDVSLSSSYEAAKTAYNRAVQAEGTAEEAAESASIAETTAKKALSMTEVVTGTQTAATNAWTGTVTGFSTLTDGQQIVYWLPFSSTGDVTLNLTLPDGSQTGAKPVYYSGTTPLNFQYPQGNAIHLTYNVNKKVGSATWTGWWCDANYYTYKDTYDKQKYATYAESAEEIGSGKLAVFNSEGKLRCLGHVAMEFDITKPILYVGTAYTAAGQKRYNNYISYGSLVTIKNTWSSGQYTAGMPVYIKGTLNGKLFKTANMASMLTCIQPTSNDGYLYMLLGTMYESSATSMYLAPEHPIYKYVNSTPGSSSGFKRIDQISYEAYAASTTISADLEITKASIEATVESLTKTRDAVLERVKTYLGVLDGTITGEVEDINYEDMYLDEEGIMTDEDVTTYVKAATEAQQTARGFSLIIKQLRQVAGELESFNSTWFSAENDGLTIGKSDSLFKTRLDNEKLAFLQGDDEIAYLSNQELNIDKASILGELRFGNIRAVPVGNALNWEYTG